MRLILLGPPGAGKGTQAKSISDKFGIPHISTGEIFRKNIKNKTALGLKAKVYIDKGELVPDDLTVAIVESRLKEDDCTAGFLLDGFPRTVKQADTLEHSLVKLCLKLDYVININVPKDSLIDRLTGRRVCVFCGNSFHIKYNPPMVAGICDVCGGQLIQRDDDSLNTVLNRMDVYTAQTAPLIEYYNRLNLLYTVDGEQDIDKVFKNVCDILGSEMK